MRIDVRLGSGLSRLVGGPHLEIEVAEGATVRDVLHGVARTALRSPTGCRPR
jgi:hypothetical protein